MFIEPNHQSLLLQFFTNFNYYIVFQPSYSNSLWLFSGDFQKVEELTYSGTYISNSNLIMFYLEIYWFCFSFLIQNTLHWLCAFYFWLKHIDILHLLSLPLPSLNLFNNLKQMSQKFFIICSQMFQWTIFYHLFCW